MHPLPRRMEVRKWIGSQRASSKAKHTRRPEADVPTDKPEPIPFAIVCPSSPSPATPQTGNSYKQLGRATPIGQESLMSNGTRREVDTRWWSIWRWAGECVRQ
ncbi:hypothetical protein BD410DRAFT_795486 [Rickenella mellea]|uniref:Uncharacterized protein n=1 Tax=Rickenella mellea TaxID=50990 RepID=A0A4Y7PMU2_9AGAM|nr:hypothetical protein BD410DRAFT_795486 [Rickenella mellea]